MSWTERMQHEPGDLLVPEWFAEARRAGADRERLRALTRTYCAESLAEGDAPSDGLVSVMLGMYLACYGEGDGCA